ncbi:hypothetical protein, partial [Methylobacterium sp. Leaf93]|uniref:hypothetical protein n=1 Tax=Methylobacterium sp. Leaf93 TaxID=1736249 RepID=UPI001AEC6F2B
MRDDLAARNVVITRIVGPCPKPIAAGGAPCRSDIRFKEVSEPLSRIETSILDGLDETSALRALPESQLQAVADAV